MRLDGTAPRRSSIFLPSAFSPAFLPPVSRALKFTLFIGSFVSLLLAAVYAPGWIRSLDVAVSGKLGLSAEHARDDPWLQYLSFVVLAFGIAWTTIDINRPAFKGLVAALALAEVFTFSALAATLYGFYFSPVLSGAAILMSFGAALVYSYSQIGQRQRVVDAEFGPRVSGEQERALVDGSAELNVEGQLQELTLVVCEIFNHQQLMDALEPARYATVSNRFLHAATDALVEQGGTLAASDGEGVRVVFGAPLPVANHASVACRAALEVARQVRRLNQELGAEHAGLTCDVRVGVNSGEMAVGHFGSRRLGGFGVAGEEVAFARRLCAANLIYGSTVLIGARTFELAESAIEARPLELLRRRIGENWLEVYELLGQPQDMTPDALARRDLFWTGVIFFREKRLADALEKFSEARATTGQADGPLDFYINRIKQLQHNKATTDWETTRLLNSL